MPKWNRRKWIAAAAATTAVVIPLYARYIEPHWLQVVRRSLPLRNLPTAWHGKTILHASDLHVGPPVEDWYLAKVFQTIESLQPDVICYTGDFVSGVTDLQTDQSKSLKHLPLGQIATIGILGNHDYGYAWNDIGRAQFLCARLKERGIRMLRNQRIRLDGLHLVGLDELWSGQLDLKTAFQGWKANWPGIALVHNPDVVDLEGWSDFQGLILAGHTHGGQVKPPFLPPLILPVQNRRYTSGLFSITSERQLYISRGIGYRIPLRFNALPELTLFELIPGQPTG